MEKINNLLMLLTIFFSLVCCTIKLKENGIVNINKKNGEIILIFENWENNYSTYKYVTVEGGILNILPLVRNSEQIEKEINDTIKINFDGQDIMVGHRFNLLNSINFLSKSGDSIIIKKDGNMPFLHIKNRITKLYDINYDYYKNSRYGLIIETEIPFYIEYGKLDFLFFSNLLSKKRFDRDSIIKCLKYQLEDERIWLDSLREENLISVLEYKFYKERNKFQALNMENIDNQRKTKDNYRELLSEYNDSLYYNDVFQYYRNYYQKLTDKYYLDSVIYLYQESFTDYKYAFDIMEEEKLIYGDLFQSIIIKWLPDIIKYNSVNTGEKYYKKVLKSLSDTILIERIKSEYEMFFEQELLNSKDLELLNKSGEILSFTHLLNRSVGKVLYIDFWASWCIPCIHEMPESLKLRDNYSNKEIVFVYLSLDDKKDNWIKGIQDANLNEVKECYLILNSKTSLLIKNLSIFSIPRYLIYDKKGNLVYAEAPSPSSDSISKILEKCLYE